MYSIYKRQMSWSIGIFEGTSPFILAQTKDTENPVISARDVSDVEAAFVADPFMVKKNRKYFMFFEVLNLQTYTGDIGYAVSEDGTNWQYQKIILDETFHLSYPCIYEWEGSYYMIPESGDDLSIRLYLAKSFPEGWEYIGNLMSGEDYSDPTAFYHDNKWWMFATKKHSGSLYLFYSDNLERGWEAHPMNPIITGNKHIARSAGRIFSYDNKMYRLAQDDFPIYGLQVYAIEITELNETSYQESSEPISIVKMTGKDWNSEGMHHVDLHLIDNEWHAVVDGRKRWP